MTLIAPQPLGKPEVDMKSLGVGFKSLEEAFFDLQKARQDVEIQSSEETPKVS